VAAPDRLTPPATDPRLVRGPGRRYVDRVTEGADLVIGSDGRMERVLDAAGELLLRWGYQRVTIEEIARRARIGKGTVYLHFRTKDALFLTLLLRAQRRSIAELVERMQADPVEVLPSRLSRSVYLSVAADPVLKALYLGDAEVLGRLVHEAEETLGWLTAERIRTVLVHLEVLRAAGVLRTDLDVHAQLHVMQAVATGFFFVDARPPQHVDLDTRADLLAHTLATALEVPGPPLPALAAAVPELTALHTSLIAQFDQEWRRRVR
jgi:AcrR family transcriptional regulator